MPLLYNHACLYRSLPHPEGKAKRLSLRGGGALIETGMVVQERHTAPVGDRVGFFADAGHSLRLLPPEVTLGTARC